MVVLKICGVAIVVLFLIIAMREAKSALVPAVKIASVVAFGAFVILTYLPLYKEMEKMMSGTPLARFLPILFRALGVAVLTQISADVCREGGEGGLAFCVETIGKMEILVIALPLVKELSSMVKALLSF